MKGQEKVDGINGIEDREKILLAAVNAKSIFSNLAIYSHEGLYGSQVNS